MLLEIDTNMYDSSFSVTFMFCRESKYSLQDRSELVQYFPPAEQFVSFLLWPAGCFNHEPEPDLCLVSAPESLHLYSQGECNLN